MSADTFSTWTNDAGNTQRITNPNYDLTGTYYFTDYQNVCPNCGYCPCCGRGRWFQPWPVNPCITWIGGSQ